jgi:predicted DNA-binding protein
MKGHTEVPPAIGIRMPLELRERLKKKAAENHRSMSGEILHRLEESLRREEKELPDPQPTRGDQAK